MKHNERSDKASTATVKNPNWSEANQLDVYKCSPEVLYRLLIYVVFQKKEARKYRTNILF